MRRVAVIGSGIAGLLAAHGLRRAGYEVTLYSDRTAEAWLAARPTGTAARFAPAIAYERELGLHHWEAEAPKIAGARVVYCPKPGFALASLTGRQSAPGAAIDVRLQSHRWMHDLEARGGEVVIEEVTAARLDAIAAANDLTIVAVGKGELASLFERDDARSVHREPQRNVAMVIVTGPPLERPETPFVGVKFQIVEGVGETAWIPYFHRDHGPCWNLIFEARPGGPMDRFLEARSGAEALAAA
ncbi:MAG: FAD-dependent oxidoreductase, partial [Myxococcales bacterium]|nr:FAD-dependent oxidoreductase [Myxococcales bacterium]